MLQAAADDQKAAVARIAAQPLRPSSTELEKLEAIYENLSEREEHLRQNLTRDRERSPLLPGEIAVA